jgi:hypothetical protein
LCSRIAIRASPPISLVESSTDSILHRDNPYNLTRTEVRICQPISEGLRPKDMFEIRLSDMTMRDPL